MADSPRPDESDGTLTAEESGAVVVLATEWVRDALWPFTQHRGKCRCPENAGDGPEDPRCVQHREYQRTDMANAVLTALDPILAAILMPDEPSTSPATPEGGA